MEQNVNQCIDQLLDKHGEVRSGEIVDAMGISRQAVHKYLQKRVQDGELRMFGSGRGARYRLQGGKQNPHGVRASNVVVVPGQKPQNQSKPLPSTQKMLRGLKLGPTVHAYAEFALLELLSNARAHAHVTAPDIRLERLDSGFAVEVSDDGLGIFQKLVQAFGLASKLDALPYLSRGFLTTQPASHRGRGLFSLAKMGDFFEIESGGIHCQVDNLREDVALGSSSMQRGTRIRFELLHPRAESLQPLLQRLYAQSQAKRTSICVADYLGGGRFASSAEAQRLLEDVANFSEVWLDFSHVRCVGQGFLATIFQRAPIGEDVSTRPRWIPLNMAHPIAYVVDTLR